MTLQSTTFILLASGRGLRVGGDVPKQYRLVANNPVLWYSLNSALQATEIDKIILVVNSQDEPFWQPIIATFNTNKIQIVYGGATRQQSVANALCTIQHLLDDSIILIHDAARPFISQALIMRAINAAQQYGAAIPVLPVVDTIKQIDQHGAVISTIPRENLRIVQTPQAFKLNILSAAHKAASQDFTDDAGLVEANVNKVFCFDGETNAFKITTEADFIKADHMMTQFETRVATGYDVHAFGTGDYLWLGGLKIPHTHSLLGHSDADPVLHALTDALLGTIGDGDIGSHFPPSDNQWKNAASHIFLEHAVALLVKSGGRLVHLDTTIVCEQPKIGTHREAMRAQIAQICNVPLNRVSVKATTSEKLGFTGRSEGIAALATVTVELPQ